MTSLCPHSLLLPMCYNVSVSCPRDQFPLSVLVSYFNPPAILFCRLLLRDKVHHRNMVQAPSQDACYVFE